jgi:CRISPR-associated protein Csd1
MIYKALVDLAEREGLLADTAYEPVEVHYLVHLGEGGKYLSYEAPRDEAASGSAKRFRPRAPRRRVPRRSGRTSGDRAEFLVDKAEFVFGIDPHGKRPEEKLAERRRLFQERAEKASTALPGKASFEALRAFLARKAPAEIRKLLTAATTTERTAAAGALFAFVYEPDGGNLCIHDDPEVKAYFTRALEEEDSGIAGQCLVTGLGDVRLSRLHAKPKGIPPRQETGGGVPLTSFNEEAFKSYGLERLGGAPISRRANLGIELAVDRLLDSAYPRPDGGVFDKQHEQISHDTAIVYWSKEDAALGWMSELEHGGPERVGELIRSPYKGRAAPLEDPSVFYALVLSGSRGRGVVRSFIESTVKDVAASLDRYREEAAIVRPYETTPGGYPLDRVKRSLVPSRDRDLKRLPPALGAELYLAILRGRPFARSLLDLAVRRNRVELLPEKSGGRPDEVALGARCSLLKAYLNRNHREGIAVALDMHRADAPYRLGRLLAVLDRLQQAALGTVNATIVDRYYGSASSTPEAVFPTLVRRSQHHVGRLRREKPGLAVNMDRLLQEVVSPLSAFPKTLNLEQQGIFALGFYHQRQDFFTKKKETDHE